jgi:hypothetical protein
MSHQPRIMYIECKSSGLFGPARIGRVTFSKSGKSIHYQGYRFHSLKGDGFKANYYNIDTGENYWISGCKKDGSDALYSTSVEIDEDVRAEYWLGIRKKPDSINIKSFKSVGKYSK